jgi:hypothetical protein
MSKIISNNNSDLQEINQRKRKRQELQLLEEARPRFQEQEDE